MPRWGRRLLLAVVLLAGLAAAASAAATFLVDVNRFRPLIARKAEESTGRPVTLGTLALRLFPSPAVSVRPLRLADSARYPGRDALRADGLSIRVGLFALLRGRLAVRSIVLDRPTLTLIRDRQGRWNFDDLLERAAAAGRAGESPGGEAPAVAVDRAVVRSGRVLVYDDFVRPGMRSEADLGPIDAVVSGLGGGGATRLDLSVGMGKSVLRAAAALDPGPADPGSAEPGRAGPTLRVRSDGSSLKAEDLAGLIPWLGVMSPAGLKVSGTIGLDGEAVIPIESPERLGFKGRLRLTDLGYRDATMARPLEGIGGTLSVDGERATWDGFTLRAGASSLAGRLRVEDFRRPRLGFELNSPRLDLNEIISTFAPAGPQPAGRPAAGADGAGPPPAAADGSAGGLLDGVSGQGTIEIKEARFQTFDLQDVRASVGLSRGVLALKEMQAGFYDGLLRGSAQVALAQAVPDYALGVGLEGVDVAPLLVAYDPGLDGLLKGRLSGRLDLTAAGVEMDAILGSARGSGSVELVQGALTSFNVLKQLASLLEMAGGKGIGRDQTPFESLRATLAVADRRGRTEDLLLRATDLDLEGKGWVGLDATLDLDATARFSEDSTRGMVEKNAGLGRLAEQGRLAVYFNLSGPLSTPAFRLDTRAQVRQVKGTARERVKEKVQDRLRDRILKHLEQPPPEDVAPDAAPPDEPPRH